MIKSELRVKKHCADSRIKGKRTESRRKQVSNGRVFNLTGRCARDVETKLAAGPESPKKSRSSLPKCSEVTCVQHESRVKWLKLVGLKRVMCSGGTVRKGTMRGSLEP